MTAALIPEIPLTMRAAMFHRPNEVRYEETPVPEPGPGEVLVKVDTALTCGTDVKCYRRGHPVLLKRFPSPFGHEFAGTVARVGDMSGWQVGERVVAANSAPCDRCFFCEKGQPNLCDSLDLLNGAYAEYILVPARIARRNMHRVPERLPFELAAFTEPLAVCLHGLAQAGVSPGDRVAILGLGPIGQLLVRGAGWKGAHVTAIARNADKLAMARDFGLADQTLSLLETPEPEAIRRRCTPEGRGFDVVIEAVGLPETWEKAVALVRKGGTVNLFGGCPGDTTVTLPTRRLHYEEIRLVSSFHHTSAHVKQALDLLADGEIDPAPLITDRQPMARFETALQQVEAGRAMKIALKNPDSEK
jgi:L-iditol 2-dehydrogenase